MTAIHFISVQPNVVNFLRSYFQRQHIDFIPHSSIKELDYQLIENLILFEPAHIAGRYLSQGALFKRYLKKKYPHVKLIITGLFPANHENFLDLYDLPLNFWDFYFSLSPLSRHWDLPIGGNNTLQQRIAYFFYGHGNRSFFSRASNFRMSLSVAYDELSSNDPDAYTYTEIVESILLRAQELWKELIMRWDNYTPLFKATPFHKELQALDPELRAFNNFFSKPNLHNHKDAFREGDYFNRFEYILARLTDLDLHYIKSEQNVRQQD